MHLRTIMAVILALALIATGLSAAATTGFGKYQDFERAEADGYIQVSQCVPGMGFHYLNPALFDDKVKTSQGEILVYALNDDDKLELVAVEYASSEQFRLLGHTAEFNPNVGGYALHAWYFLPNSDGLTADFNTRVDETCHIN